MTIIIGSNRGAVERDVEREQIVRTRLKEIDPLLDIRFFPMAAIAPDGSFQGRHALVCQWPESDARWKMHRSGEIGEPFDLLGWFVEPDESGDFMDAARLPVSPSELLDKVVEFLGKCDNTRQPWKERMRKAMEHNRDLQLKRKLEVQDEMVQGMAYYAKKLAGEPIVNLRDGKSPGA